MAQNELHLKVTLRIYSDDDQRCFGPGIATCCSGCGSTTPSGPEPPLWKWPTPRRGVSSHG